MSCSPCTNQLLPGTHEIPPQEYEQYLSQLEADEKVPEGMQLLRPKVGASRAFLVHNRRRSVGVPRADAVHALDNATGGLLCEDA